MRVCVCVCVCVYICVCAAARSNTNAFHVYDGARLKLAACFDSDFPESVRAAARATVRGSLGRLVLAHACVPARARACGACVRVHACLGLRVSARAPDVYAFVCLFAHRRTLRLCVLRCAVPCHRCALRHSKQSWRCTRSACMRSTGSACSRLRPPAGQPALLYHLCAALRPPAQWAGAGAYPVAVQPIGDVCASRERIRW